jgi:hypothetical protein
MIDSNALQLTIRSACPAPVVLATTLRRDSAPESLTIEGIAAGGQRRADEFLSLTPTY